MLGESTIEVELGRTVLAGDGGLFNVRAPSAVIGEVCLSVTAVGTSAERVVFATTVVELS
jgi:hypothetical protein